MKNIPTKEEVIGYIKSDKKTIGWTIGGFVFLFLLLMTYSLYSTFTDMREEEELYLSQDEIVAILDREPEEVTAGDIRNIEESLEQNRYAFGVLIEREDQSFYNYPSLITEFLISEEVVNYVESQINGTILPSPELAVEVSEDSSTRIQEVIIGTGDEEDNRLIAEAYYDAFQEEGLIPPLSDKIIYMMDDEPFLIEEETWVDLVMAQIQYVSPARAVIGLFIMSILGLLAGIILVLLKTFFRKEIPFMYELKRDESDTVLYFNQVKTAEPAGKYSKLTHAIMTYPERKKIVLTQNQINDQFAALISERAGTDKNEPVLMLNDFEKTPINMHLDEVIILVEQNVTTKDWYKAQRIQLERISVPVTILTY